jgi:hypothetical protein
LLGGMTLVLMILQYQRSLDQKRMIYLDNSKDQVVKKCVIFASSFQNKIHLRWFYKHLIKTEP